MMTVNQISSVFIFEYSVAFKQDCVFGLTYKGEVRPGMHHLVMKLQTSLEMISGAGGGKDYINFWDKSVFDLVYQAHSM